MNIETMEEAERWARVRNLRLISCEALVQIVGMLRDAAMQLALKADELEAVEEQDKKREPT